MHVDDSSTALTVRAALEEAHAWAEVARVAALGLAYGADRHGDLDLVHAAEQAAHKAGLATASLTAATVTLETEQTRTALGSRRVRTNAERRAGQSPSGDSGGF